MGKCTQAAFLYNGGLRLWQRISDSRFQFSDFYSNVGSVSSNFDKAQNRTLSHLDKCTSSSMTHMQPVSSGDITRCHCEDRMVCALALKSYDEFRYWLRYGACSLFCVILLLPKKLTHWCANEFLWDRMYIRRIVSSSNNSAEALRFFVDVIVGKNDPMLSSPSKIPAISFWGHCYDDTGSITSDLSPKMILIDVILPEVARIPALQRLANEIRVEVDAMFA